MVHRACIAYRKVCVSRRYSRLVLSIDGIAARSRQTKPDIGRIVRPPVFNGACTMRRVHPVHPSIALASRTQRAICVLEDPPPPSSTTRPVSNPFFRSLPFSSPLPTLSHVPSATKRSRNSGSVGAQLRRR